MFRFFNVYKVKSFGFAIREDQDVLNKEVDVDVMTIVASYMHHLVRIPFALLYTLNRYTGCSSSEQNKWKITHKSHNTIHINTASKICKISSFESKYDKEYQDHRRFISPSRQMFNMY